MIGLVNRRRFYSKKRADIFKDNKALAQVAASGALFARFAMNRANSFLTTQEVVVWRGEREHEPLHKGATSVN
jgi:hypothetical protein